MLEKSKHCLQYSEICFIDFGENLKPFASKTIQQNVGLYILWVQIFVCFHVVDQYEYKSRKYMGIPN